MFKVSSYATRYPSFATGRFWPDSAIRADNINEANDRPQPNELALAGILQLVSDPEHRISPFERSCPAPIVARVKHEGS